MGKWAWTLGGWGFQGAVCVRACVKYIVHVG